MGAPNALKEKFENIKKLADFINFLKDFQTFAGCKQHFPPNTQWQGERRGSKKLWTNVTFEN